MLNQIHGPAGPWRHNGHPGRHALLNNLTEGLQLSGRDQDIQTDECVREIRPHESASEVRSGHQSLQVLTTGSISDDEHFHAS